MEKTAEYSRISITLYRNKYFIRTYAIARETERSVYNFVASAPVSRDLPCYSLFYVVRRASPSSPERERENERRGGGRERTRDSFRERKSEKESDEKRTRRGRMTRGRGRAGEGQKGARERMNDGERCRTTPGLIGERDEQRPRAWSVLLIPKNDKEKNEKKREREKGGEGGGENRMKE